MQLFTEFATTRQLPKNREYAELESLLNPRSLDNESVGKLEPELGEWFTTPRKQSVFKAAVAKGQYEFPKGIIFGGTKPAWSNIAIREFIQSLPTSLKSGIVLDVHTGLGDSGALEMFTNESGDKYSRIKEWFPGRKLTNLGSAESLGYEVTGSIDLAFTQPNSPTPWHFVTLEFGTQPLMQVFLALQADNWLHCFAGAEHPLRSRVQQMMKDAFSVSSVHWQDQVLGTTLGVITQAVHALQS